MLKYEIYKELNEEMNKEFSFLQGLEINSY